MANDDYKMCPLLMLGAAACPPGEPGGITVKCWEDMCAWYDRDAEMCSVPMLSCSLWEVVKNMHRRPKQ